MGILWRRVYKTKMFRFYLKSIWWLLKWGVILGFFVIMPLLPIYGWLSPWPAANEGLKKEGVNGLQLVVGCGYESKFESDKWKEERFRQFLIIPESLSRIEMVTYQEIRGSGINGVRKEVIRDGSWSWIGVPVIWLLAAAFWTRIAIRRFRLSRL